jgi:hypothetical protein
MSRHVPPLRMKTRNVRARASSGRRLTTDTRFEFEWIPGSGSFLKNRWNLILFSERIALRAKALAALNICGPLQTLTRFSPHRVPKEPTLLPNARTKHVSID